MQDINHMQAHVDTSIEKHKVNSIFVRLHDYSAAACMKAYADVAFLLFNKLHTCQSINFNHLGEYAYTFVAKTILPHHTGTQATHA